MNEVEYIFKTDIKEKKSGLSGARGMKRGSKSKKCTLPSDYLTRSQKQKLNGEVKSYNMNEPVTYEKFKSMPLDLQENYLVHLIDEYHVTGSNLADMMGIVPKTLYTYLASKNLNGYLPGKGHRMPKECQKAWEEFLASKTGKNLQCSTRDASYYQKAEDKIIEPTTEVTKSTSDEPVPVELVSSCKMRSFSISYEGALKFKEIAAYLELMLGENPVGHLDITFRKV